MAAPARCVRSSALTSPSGRCCQSTGSWRCLTTAPGARPAIFFIFDCGTLPDRGGIRLQAEELDDCRFAAEAELAGLLAGFALPRVRAALDARGGNGARYVPRPDAGMSPAWPALVVRWPHRRAAAWQGPGGSGGRRVRRPGSQVVRPPRRPGRAREARQPRARRSRRARRPGGDCSAGRTSVTEMLLPGLGRQRGDRCVRRCRTARSGRTTTGRSHS